MQIKKKINLSVIQKKKKPCYLTLSEYACVQENKFTLITPGDSELYIVLSDIGGTTSLLVHSLEWCPECMSFVPKLKSLSTFTVSSSHIFIRFKKERIQYRYSSFYMTIVGR
jgi:hypothetical protein